MTKKKAEKSQEKKPKKKPSQPAEAGKKSLVVFLLDSTGSMNSYREATIDSFNEYVQGIQADDEAEDTAFTLVTFNSDAITTVSKAIPIKEAAMLDGDSYKPRATTPLYDAIGTAVRDTERFLKDNPAYGEKGDERVLCVILTDGLENASQEFTREGVFKMLRDKEDGAGWRFVYLGANQDAYAVGQSIGVAAGSIANYEMGKLGEAMSVTSSASLGHIKARKMARHVDKEFFRGENLDELSDRNKDKPT